MLGLFLFSGIGIKAQELEGALWESQRGQPAERVNYSLKAPYTVLKKSVSFHFFPTNSGRSGELKKVYYKIQILNKTGLRAFQSFLVPQATGKLTHLDYRIWQEGYITYEAKKQSVAQRIQDTLWDATRAVPLAYQMTFPELNYPCVLEFYFQLEGVAVPYAVPLSDVYPLQKSELRIEILSADPLDYRTLGEVKDSTYSAYDVEVYQFTAQNTTAEKPTAGLLWYDPKQPKVFLRWQDLVYRYDRDGTNGWGPVLKRHFYRGPIKHYSVFVNSEASFLGRSIYWGSLSRPQRFYRYRRQKLEQNQQRAWGHRTLSRKFLNPLVDLQEWTNLLGKRPEITVEQGLRMIDQKIENYIKRQLEGLFKAPYEYVDYALLAKFYLDFLEAKGKNPHYVVAKPAWQGPIFKNFYAIDQFSAMAVAYPQANGRLNYKMVGPYLGTTYAQNQWPSDYEKGQLLIYHPQKDTAWIKPIPSEGLQGSSISISDNLQVSFRYNWARRQRSFKTHGLFQNKMYQAYLQKDTAQDGLSYTPFQRGSNAVLGRPQFELPREQTRQKSDTFTLALPLEDLLLVKGVPLQTQIIQLPTAYAVQYTLRLKADKPFELSLDPSWQLLSKKDSGVTLQQDSISPKERELQLRVTFSAKAQNAPSINRYLQLQALAQSGLRLNIRLKDGT